MRKGSADLFPAGKYYEGREYYEYCWAHRGTRENRTYTAYALRLAKRCGIEEGFYAGGTCKT